MGQCFARGNDNVNREVEEELQKSALAQRNEVKLLLLGK